MNYIGLLSLTAYITSQTSKKLVEYYSKLRELGHPEYLGPTVGHTLRCSFTQEEADEAVCHSSCAEHYVAFIIPLQMYTCVLMLMRYLISLKLATVVLAV